MPTPTSKEAERYHKHQHTLAVFENVEKSQIWKKLVEGWKEDIREQQRYISKEENEVKVRWRQGRIQQLEDNLDYAKTKITEARDFIAQFHEKYGEVKG